jgi:hypothetical protein
VLSFAKVAVGDFAIEKGRANMKIEELRNLDREDMLGWLGLQSKSSKGAWLAGTAGIFGVGLLVGAGLALLIAPKPGRELREDLRGKLRRLPEELQQQASSVIGRENSKNQVESSNKTY